MTSVAAHRDALARAADPAAYLRSVSGLPGPRGNLEAVLAAAESIDDPALLRSWAGASPDAAPGDRPEVVVVMAGVVGLGRVAAQRGEPLAAEVRAAARDPRWRVREAAAMALQRIGDDDPERLGAEARRLVAGDALERRAAVAAVAEPRLLRRPAQVATALEVLDAATAALVAEADRRAEAVRTLRQALGYAWSVVVAADPAAGRPGMEGWLADPDPDVRWIMRQNLRRARMRRADPGWTGRWQAALARAGGPRGGPRGAGPASSSST